MKPEAQSLPPEPEEDSGCAMRFAARVTELRETRHWKQSELAAVTGMTRAYIKHIEDGHARAPSARTIGLLAVALGADPIELLQLCGALPQDYGDNRFREELDMAMYLRRQRRLSEEFTNTVIRLIRLAEADEEPEQI